MTLARESELEYTPPTCSPSRPSKGWSAVGGRRSRLFPAHVASRRLTYARVGCSMPRSSPPTPTTTGTVSTGRSGSYAASASSSSGTPRNQLRSVALSQARSPGPTCYWTHTKTPSTQARRRPPQTAAASTMSSAPWRDADVRDDCLGDELLTVTWAPTSLSEAKRASRGAMLRQEVYAVDGAVRRAAPEQRGVRVNVMGGCTGKGGVRTHAAMLAGAVQDSLLSDRRAESIRPRASAIGIALRVDSTSARGWSRSSSRTDVAAPTPRRRRRTRSRRPPDSSHSHRAPGDRRWPLIWSDHHHLPRRAQQYVEAAI